MRIRCKNLIFTLLAVVTILFSKSTIAYAFANQIQYYKDWGYMWYYSNDSVWYDWNGGCYQYRFTDAKPKIATSKYDHWAGTVNWGQWITSDTDWSGNLTPEQYLALANGDPNAEPPQRPNIEYNPDDTWGTSMGLSQPNHYRRVALMYYRNYVPQLQWVSVGNANYINGNDYWFTPNRNIIVTDTWLCNVPGSNRVCNNYINLTNNGNEVFEAGIYEGYPGDSIWVDNNNGWITGYDARWDAGSPQEEQQHFTVVSGVETDYHLYVNAINSDVKWASGSQYPGVDSGYNIRIDGTAPTHSSYEIKNVDESGYDVYVYGAADTRSGINHIAFPTWTENNGQDDITWENGEDLGGGTWHYRVNSYEHNDEIGKYYTHVYMYDNVGNCSSFALPIINTSKPPTISIDPQSSSWTNNINPIIDYIDNSGSGLRYKHYAITDSESKPSSDLWKVAIGTSQTVSFNSDGIYYVHAETQDSCDNYTYTYAGKFYIDKTPPKVTANPTNTNWTNSNISVTLTATDGGSGVNHIYYAWSTSKDTAPEDWEWTPVNVSGATATAIIPQDKEGNRYLWYYADDNTDTPNASPKAYSGLYQIDKTPPTVTADPTDKPWTNSNISVTLTATDEGSGVNHIYYAWSNSKTTAPTAGEWKTADVNGSTAKVTTTQSGEGQWYLWYYADDNTNTPNVSPKIYSGLYQIDKTPPMVTVSPTSKSWSNSDVSVTLTATDGRSGVGHIYYAWSTSKDTQPAADKWERVDVDGGTATAVATQSDEGQWYLWYYADDNSDTTNASPKLWSGLYQIDKTSPTVTANPEIEPWTNSDVSVTLTATDEGSGVNHIYYAWSTSEDSEPAADKWKTADVNGATATAIAPQSIEGQWYLWYYADDNTNTPNVSDKLCSGLYQIDKTPPTGTFTPNSQDWTYEDVTTLFTPLDNGGSGIKKWRYRTSLNKGAWGDWSTYTYGDTPTDITLSGVGQWEIQAEVVDGASNLGEVYSGIYKIFDPTPTQGNLEVRKYDYKQNDNTYWLKAETYNDNNSDADIYTEGYFPQEYHVYPTRTYLALAKDGVLTDKSSQQYADTSGDYSWGDEYDEYFDNTSGDAHAIETNLNGRNYISADHHLRGLKDGISFKLFYTTSFIGDKEYKANYTDSGKWLKVDGIAPGFIDTSNEKVDSKVQSAVNMDSNFNININVSGLYDNESGINSVYAKFYPTDEFGGDQYENQAKTVQLSNLSGTWVMPQQGAYDLFPYATYKTEYMNVDIYTKDNVGNIGKIKTETLDLFTVKAYVVPYQDPNYNPDTQGLYSFKSGQYAILKIFTGGYPDKLEITYPDELTEIDGSLNKDGDKAISITPQKNLYTQIVFKIPEYTPCKSNYIIDVVAHRTAVDSTREDDSPKFNVGDNIFNGIRTRINNP